MKKIDRFSVLMSVYYKDNPVFLKEALESLLNQTLIPDEIVLVKDGPVGKAIEYEIERFAKRIAHKLNVISLSKNQGLGNALNEGLRYCSHDIVARMDSDDICLRERFEVQIKQLIDNGNDVVGSNVLEFSSTDNSSGKIRAVPETHEEIAKYAKTRNPVNHPSVMFKKKTIQDVGGYIDINGFEDYFLWARLLMRGAKFYNIQKPLLRFRVTPDTYMRRGGLNYLKQELYFRRELLRIGFLKKADFILGNFPRFLVRLAPNCARRAVYSRFLRTN